MHLNIIAAPRLQNTRKTNLRKVVTLWCFQANCQLSTSNERLDFNDEEVTLRLIGYLVIQRPKTLEETWWFFDTRKFEHDSSKILQLSLLAVAKSFHQCRFGSQNWWQLNRFRTRIRCRQLVRPLLENHENGSMKSWNHPEEPRWREKKTKRK